MSSIRLTTGSCEHRNELYSNIYPTRCNVTQFNLSGNCSTCFGWYLHPSSGAQTTVSTASGICHTVTATCRYRGRVGTGLCVLTAWLSHRSGRQPKTYVKPEAAITVFELLMMGGVSPETCWAIKKHWNNKFYYTVASCLFFLWVLYYDARIHDHQVQVNLFWYATLIFIVHNSDAEKSTFSLTELISLYNNII